MNTVQRWFLSPYTVMGVVLVMYTVKVLVKLSVGYEIHSPILIGDGYHNGSDIVEALLVIMVLKIAALPVNGKYPFGRRNVESIFQLVGGVLLFGVAFNILVLSITGILSFLPAIDAAVREVVSLPEHKPLVVEPAYFWIVVGVVAVSAVLSYAVSAYQIYVGGLANRKSLVVDGEETKSDGRIELIVLVGVLTEYLSLLLEESEMLSPIASYVVGVEYLLGIFIVVKLCHVGWEFVSGGWRTLLQRTIGKEHDAKIQEIAKSMYGVVGVSELQTFSIGTLVICIIKVTTKTSAESEVDIKYGMAYHINEYLRQEGFREAKYFIRFDRPDPERHRVALAVVKVGDEAMVAPSFEGASHLYIADMRYGKIHRCTENAMPISISDLIELLRSKRVAVAHAFHESGDVIDVFENAGITYSSVHTIQPII